MFRKTGNQSHSSKPIDYEFLRNLKNMPLGTALSANKGIVKELFTDCSDFVIRDFWLSDGRGAFVIYIDGLVDSDLVNDALASLMEYGKSHKPKGDPGERIDSIVQPLPVSQTKEINNYGELLTAVLGGDTALFIDDSEIALLLGLRGPKTRSVEEPASETVVRGPRDGFNESLRVNTSLIRRRLKTPRLKAKAMVIGEQSNTNITIMYLDGIADPKRVEEVESRLRKIKIDAILESGYIEELIQDNVYSPFPQVQYTERPDVVSAGLLQGRIAIITDGTPFVLLVPLVFWELIQASEDYYERFGISTLIRILRYTFLFLALFTPALYIAVTTFHPDMIPTTLLLSIAAAREAIPFPAVIEAFIMEVTFEALREAGIRLPKAIGQAVSILGALVIGQAAVEAGIVSAPMVIVVSITGIASFTIPRFNGAIAIRLLRFPLMILASLFGIYGIIIGTLFILVHMAGLRSFGVPYMSPVGPLKSGELHDIWIRAPWHLLQKRPSSYEPLDSRRIGTELPEKINKNSGQKGVEHEEN
ncbi:spore germination protein [Paenibacillus turpanensis]|uniref:spore germination protein n=1 Tax=Paenibacillus turpanensis TaxID=2689078 RepID=UPI001409864F|nr:spore germination protein [Paenibacillus turpanensis]